MLEDPARRRHLSPVDQRVLAAFVHLGLGVGAQRQETPAVLATDGVDTAAGTAVRLGGGDGRVVPAAADMPRLCGRCATARGPAASPGWAQTGPTGSGAGSTRRLA